MATITIDPQLVASADAYRAELASAQAADADASAKFAECKAKYDALKARLDDGDTTPTVPSLTSSAAALSRTEIIAGGTRRRLARLTSNPQIPSTGLAIVLIEALAPMYPCPVVITNDSGFQPDVLPSLVLVVPMTPGTSHGSGVLSLRQIELILHRSNPMERHHDLSKIARAVERLGWRVKVEAVDESDLRIRVKVEAGYEAVPDMTPGVRPGKERIADALGRLLGGDYLAGEDTFTAGWSTTVLDSDQVGDVVTTRIGLRVEAWEKGFIQLNQTPAVLADGGRLGTVKALAVMAEGLAGLTEWGRIVGVETVKGIPAWNRSLPELRARRLPVSNDAGTTTYGVKAIGPCAQTFAILDVVSKAQPIVEDEDEDGSEYAPGTEPDGYYAHEA